MSILTGNVLRTRATFKDFDGAAVDPVAVSLKVRKPDTSMVTHTPTLVTVGVYSQLVPLDQAGVWQFKWIGTGDYGSVEEFSVEVTAPTIT